MPEHAPHEPEVTSDDLRRLPLWARRYAASRSLGLLISQGIFAVGFAAFAGLGLLAGSAHRAGDTPALVVWYVLLAVFAVFWVWFSLVGANRCLGASVAYLYRHEGEVTVLPEGVPSDAASRRAKTAIALLIGALLVAALVGIVWSRWAHLPSASIDRSVALLTPLIAVPFLVVLWALNRSAMSPVLLVWPALIGLHVLLIVAGAPIVFTGPLAGLNVAIPFIGYGLLTGLIGHLYNRYALARMRELAGSAEPDDEVAQP